MTYRTCLFGVGPFRMLQVNRGVVSALRARFVAFRWRVCLPKNFALVRCPHTWWQQQPQHRIAVVERVVHLKPTRCAVLRCYHSDDDGDLCAAVRMRSLRPSRF